MVSWGNELLALRPNLELEDHSFSAVRDCLQGRSKMELSNRITEI